MTAGVGRAATSFLIRVKIGDKNRCILQHIEISSKITILGVGLANKDNLISSIKDIPISCLVLVCIEPVLSLEGDDGYQLDLGMQCPSLQPRLDWKPEK